MPMGCVSCSSSGGRTEYVNTNVVISEDCEYTVPMVEQWKDKLFCVRDNNYLAQLNITKGQLNAFLGIVLSVLKTQNACYFKPNLDTIKPYITVLTGLDIC